MYRCVVPLDGSQLAERALPLAQRLAYTVEGTIELVHVLEPGVAGCPAVAEQRPAAERYLARVASRVSGPIAVHTWVLAGDPVTEVLKFAHQGFPSLIVMATHGHGGLRRLVFGSVADKVVREASVPVALARVAPPPTDAEWHLLVPLDGSALAAAALPIAARLAQSGTIHLIRVVGVSSDWPGLERSVAATIDDQDIVAELIEERIDAARADLDRVAERLRRAGRRVFWEVRVGRPSETILRVAETTGTDLIVMATHGRGGLRRWAFGSVTDEVLRRSGVPILVVPPGGQQSLPEPPSDAGGGAR